MTEEIAEEMKEGHGRKRNRNESEETEEHYLPTLTRYKDSRPCPTVRSRALGHSACFKSILRTIILQDLTLTAFNVSEKSTYMQDST